MAESDYNYMAKQFRIPDAQIRKAKFEYKREDGSVETVSYKVKSSNQAKRGGLKSVLPWKKDKSAKGPSAGNPAAVPREGDSYQQLETHDVNSAQYTLPSPSTVRREFPRPTRPLPDTPLDDQEITHDYYDYSENVSGGISQLDSDIYDHGQSEYASPYEIPQLPRLAEDENNDVCLPEGVQYINHVAVELNRRPPMPMPRCLTSTSPDTESDNVEDAYEHIEVDHSKDDPSTSALVPQTTPGASVIPSDNQEPDGDYGYTDQLQSDDDLDDYDYYDSCKKNLESLRGHAIAQDYPVDDSDHSDTDGDGYVKPSRIPNELTVPTQPLENSSGGSSDRSSDEDTYDRIAALQKLNLDLHNQDSNFTKLSPSDSDREEKRQNDRGFSKRQSCQKPEQNYYSIHPSTDNVSYLPMYGDVKDSSKLEPEKKDGKTTSRRTDEVFV